MIAEEILRNLISQILALSTKLNSAKYDFFSLSEKRGSKWAKSLSENCSSAKLNSAKISSLKVCTVPKNAMPQKCKFSVMRPTSFDSYKTGQEYYKCH